MAHLGRCGAISRFNAVSFGQNLVSSWNPPRWPPLWGWRLPKIWWMAWERGMIPSIWHYIWPQHEMKWVDVTIVPICSHIKANFQGDCLISGRDLREFIYTRSVLCRSRQQSTQGTLLDSPRSGCLSPARNTSTYISTPSSVCVCVSCCNKQFNGVNLWSAGGHRGPTGTCENVPAPFRLLLCWSPPLLFRNLRRPKHLLQLD